MESGLVGPVFQDAHADGCVAVLHKPKDVAQTSEWLQTVRDSMGQNFYIVIMEELMVTENYIGRQNPNLKRDTSYELEMPAQYRTAGYPDAIPQ